MKSKQMKHALFIISLACLLSHLTACDNMHGETKRALSDAAQAVVQQVEQEVAAEVENALSDVLGPEENISEDESSTPAKASEKQKGNIRKAEIPGKMHGVPERIIEHTGYTLSFNREHNNPNWVAWELTAEESEGTLARTDEFLPDPDVPAPHRVTTADYRGSGYDRGHMVPAADMKWSQRAMSECFYMSNMCPQDHSLNSGPWSTLEKACRRWAKNEGAVYVVCGPVYKSTKPKTIGSALRISVPDGFFKVVLSLRKGKEKAIGFYYANRDGKQPMHETATTVDAIEQLTGIDFFVNIPDRLEQRIEAECALKKWQ